jgi:quercetin dioxygenase-like cupin family protein
MPTKGQVLVIPESGDSYEFIETAKDSGGKKVVVKSTVNTKGQIVPKHFHLLQDEEFEVLSGELTVWVNGETKQIKAGEKVLLEKMKPHNHYNSLDEPAVYRHTVSPALDFDYFIENLVGLAADGKGKNGKFGLIQELVTLRYSDSKAVLADIPVGIQKFMMHTIAPFARLFGYRAIYSKYSGFEK